MKAMKRRTQICRGDHSRRKDSSITGGRYAFASAVRSACKCVKNFQQVLIIIDVVMDAATSVIAAVQSTKEVNKLATA